MKRIASVMLVALAAILFTACSSNTPEGVVSRALDCSAAGDYDGYIDLLNGPDDQKDQLKAMVKDKVEKGKIQEDQQVGSYKILGSELNPNDDSKATVEVEMTTKGGRTSKSKIAVVKNDAGDWRIDARK